MIALVLAIALPQFAPLLVFSRSEGAARHLAAYGREVMTYCALGQRHLTVQIDLDAQEMWCLEWPDVPIEDLLSEVQQDFLRSMGTTSQLLTQPDSGDSEATQGAFEAVVRFNERRERSMARRVEKLKENEEKGLLDEIGPLFEQDFTLDDATAMEPEEVTELLLRRVRLRDGLAITRVDVGAESFVDGIVEVDAAPTGLMSQVALQLESDAGDAYTITWDPAMNEGRFESGWLPQIASDP